MGKIFSAPEHIQKPEFENVKGYREAVKKYEEEIRNFCITDSKCKSGYVGKSVGFPVADGKAEYIIYSIKPLELIHIDTWDEYEYPYIDKLPAKTIKEVADKQEKLAKLFNPIQNL